jgi:flagellar basal-body rod modification protein FlgD
MQIRNPPQLPQSVLDAINKATQNANTVGAPVGGAAGAGSATKAAALDQNQFLTLMLAQLKNQDPTQPVDSAAFLGQLAQISQVQGLAQLNDSFSSLSSSLTSNQALQASSLLGRNALVAGDSVSLGAGGGISGAVDLPQASGQVVVNVTDGSGALVQQINLGVQPQGLAKFSWDGTMTDGTRAPAGVYKLSALYAGAGKQPTAAATLINAPVLSVTMGAGQTGLTLNLAGVGNVAFSSVRQIS